jgi:hypothetical protein
VAGIAPPASYRSVTALSTRRIRLDPATPPSARRGSLSEVHLPVPRLASSLCCFILVRSPTPGRDTCGALTSSSASLPASSALRDVLQHTAQLHAALQHRAVHPPVPVGSPEWPFRAPALPPRTASTSFVARHGAYPGRYWTTTSGTNSVLERTQSSTCLLFKPSIPHLRCRNRLPGDQAKRRRLPRLDRTVPSSTTRSLRTTHAPKIPRRKRPHATVSLGSLASALSLRRRSRPRASSVPLPAGTL